MTVLNGRDVSVGVAPMIASLLAERPQSFVAHGRPSPPIAAILGRFTADEVSYRIGFSRCLFGCSCGWGVDRPPPPSMRMRTNTHP